MFKISLASSILRQIFFQASKSFLVVLGTFGFLLCKNFAMLSPTVFIFSSSPFGSSYLNF